MGHSKELDFLLHKTGPEFRCGTL